MSDDIEIRPFQPADLGGVVALLNRCLTADRMTIDTFQRKVVLDPNFDVRGAPVARSGGQVVGFALGVTRRCRLEDAAPDFDRSWITLIAVDEGFRRRGIATRMVREIEAFFALSDCARTYVSSYAPNYFIPGVDVAAYPEALEFFQSVGFEEVYRPLAMDADLANLRTPDWVIQKEKTLSGVVTVEVYRPELALPLLDFMKSDFPGDWQRFAREAMVRVALGEFRPDNIWIAHKNGRVIGCCRHDNEGRFGPLGVCAAERGQGVGAVLLFNCLHAMRAKGLCNAWLLWTDDKVAQLYAQAGFVETRRFAVLKKELNIQD